MSVFMILLIAWIYFVPALVARRRRHHNRVAIFALNLLAGWTAVGWIIVLVWALTQAINGSQAVIIDLEIAFWLSHRRGDISARPRRRLLHPLDRRQAVSV